MKLRNVEEHHNPFTVDGVFSTLQHSTFGIERGQARSYSRDDDVHVAVTYELNPDLTVVTNVTQYSIFSWLAEMGGLSVAIFLLLRVLVALLTHSDFENFLVSQLYT